MAEAARAEGEETFQRKIQYLGDFGKTIGIPEVDSQVLSQVMLSVLDERWKDHLYDLDQLRNAIQYRAWGQKDPLVEYKREAFEMFEDLMHDIQSTFTERFFKIQVSAEPPRSGAARRRRVAPPAPVRAPRQRRGRPVCHPARDAGLLQPVHRFGRPSQQLAGSGWPRHGGRSRGWAGTTPAPAARGRSTRSATEPAARPRKFRRTCTIMATGSGSGLLS